MRTLERNKTDFEYFPYKDVSTDVDANGDHTGDYSDKREYYDPVPYRGNISTPSGQANQTFYGMNIQYTHILVMDPPKDEFNEYGLVRWKGNMYEVKAVRQSLNCFSAALKQMTKDNAPEPALEEPEGDEP